MKRFTLFVVFIIMIVSKSFAQTISDDSPSHVIEKAEQGDMDAQYEMGVNYATGSGVSKNMSLAADWFEKAAEQGHIMSQYNIGACYLKGKGIPQDYQQAFYWFMKAAEQGEPHAQYNLGVCYENGEGTKKVLKQAVL